MRLTEVIREDQSGAYSIGARSTWSRYPESEYAVHITFGADPARAKELVQKVQEVVGRLRDTPVDESYIKRSTATEKATYAKSIQDNAYWLGNLTGLSFNNRSFSDILTYPDLVDGLNAEKVRRAAVDYLNDKRYVQVILYPADWADN